MLVWSRGELCPLGYKVIGKIHTEEGPKLTLKGDTNMVGPSGGTQTLRNDRNKTNMGRSWRIVRKNRVQMKDNVQLQNV